MDEKYYTTPNGTIVGESTLRSKYGEKFDSFLSDGKITEVAETIYETPNGSLIQESVLKDKYGEKFNTFLSDGKLKKKEQTKPTQTVQAQQKAPTQAAPLPGLGGVSEEPTQSPVRAPKGIKRTTEVKFPQYDSPSTVLMAHYGDYSPPEANGKYVAFPTIFPKDPDNQTSNPNDWIVAESEDQAYEIAKKRGEVLYYDTQEEAASVAEGSWKENQSPTPSVGQGVLRNVDRTQPRGEAFIQGVSDLTRTDVREPKVSGEELPTGPTGPTGATGAIQPVEFEGVAVTPTGAAVDLGAQYREEKRVQSERNENIKKYGLDVTKGQLTDVFEFPIPEEEDIESYLSKQVGRVTASANNIVNNPKAFGLPADISQMNPNEREEVVDRYIARNYEFRGNGVNMSESELRNVFNQKFDQALAKKKADRDVMLAKQRTEELDRAGVPKEAQRTITINEIKKSDVASMTDINEVNLYSSNQKLQELAGKIASTKDPVKIDELTNEYNSELNKSNRLREELGDDRRIMVDYLTGQHVDKLSDDDDADITEAVNAQIVEFNQPTYKDQLDDIYIKVGLRDQRHREYGDNVTDDVTIGTKGMARDFSSDAAINRLRSLGYEEVGGVGEVTFKNVPLREQASSYVINVLGDDKRERAERWIATNKQNLIEKEALKNMVLLNVDPGKFEKSLLARGVEVLTEESLPSYVSVDKAIGFTSDRKLIDAALPLLQEEGIELTKDQEQNLKRTFGEEATEATTGMVPVIAKLALINSIAGPVRTVSGFGTLVDRLSKSKSLVDKGIALFLDASFEEAQMQAAGFDPGTGFGFNVAGKLFKGVGLDKFPIRGKGEMARFNKSADALWNHAIKGATSSEFASNVEAVIKDFEGGETWKNFSDENYSDLSDVTKRMLVNGIAFGVLGARDLGFFVKKGKSGFNISNMETARDEAQRKGYKEEADMLTKYINEYYAGKPGKAQPASYNDMKLFVENVPENESRRFTVSSLEEVPVEFRDRAKKNESVETEVDRTFLGIPLGKKKVNSGESYSYEITGKEIREVFNKKKEGKTETEFEEEFDMSQKAEEPPVSEEVTETETTVTEPTGDIVPAKQKGRLTRFTTSQDGIVGEVTYEDGTKKELTQEEYDALEKQEGLFDVETGTQPVAETPVEETVSAPTEVAEEAAPVELKEGEIDITTVVAEASDVDKNPENYGYHGGTLGGKSDMLTMGYEGEQPFTGYYFYGDRERAERRGDRSKIDSKEARAVDFSKYNLIKPTTEGYWVLKNGVKKIWNNILKEKEIDSQIDRIEEFVPDVGKRLRENKEKIDGWFDEWQEMKDTNFATRDYEKSKTERFETFLLKKLGYEGVDVRGLKDRNGEGSPDKGAEGSVIFDLKDGTVVDITPKKEQDAVQKQAAGKVPVQPEAKAGEKVEEGKPKTEAEKPTKEGKEVLSEEDAKSEEKVKEFDVEKQMSDEKKNEEADKEIESKSEEELKEDVPDVLESISETEREKLDREAKFKGKSTVDYVIDYLKGKLKNVRQSIKNILDKIKSNYRRAFIATSIVVDLFGVTVEGRIAYEYLNGKEIIEAYETGGKEAAAIKFAEENPEIFKTSLDVLKYTDASPKLAGRLSNVGIKAGVIEPVKLKYKESDYTKEDGITDGYFDRKTNEEIIEIVEDRNGLKIASTRSTFPASKGTEVILQGNNAERKAAGKKEVEGAKYIAHYGLDDNVLSGKRHKDTPPIHRRSMKIDGFVPYVLKRVGDRVVYTYKRYSEIADTSKDIYEVLKDRNILDPLRQYNYDDIQWGDTVGAEVYLSSSELLLKEGTPNVYREGIKTHDAGKAAHPLGTYIMWTPNSKKMNKKGERNGQTNYGRYNGGSFLLLFNDKHGNPFVRNFTGSVDGIRREGESVAKEFGIPTSEITVAFHDAGSVSGKPVAVDGKITERENHMVNDHNPNATFGYVVPMKNEILTKTSDPISGERETPIGLMALPLLFAGTGRKRRRKPLEDADADKVVTDWMEDVQKIYDAQKTKDKQEAVNEAATNLALSGRLNEIAPDQRLKVLEDIAKQTAAMDEKKSVSITSELQGLTLKEQFKQGFEEYVSAMKQKESDRKEKAKESAQKKIDAEKEKVSKLKEKAKEAKEEAKQGFEEYLDARKRKEAERIQKIETKLRERIDKLKEKAKEAVQNAKDDVAARKIFNEIIKAEMNELGLGTLKQSEVTRLLSMAKNADRKEIETLTEKAIDLMVKAARKNLKKAAEKTLKDLKSRIKNGDFGANPKSAIVISNIPIDNIPVELLPEYFKLLNDMTTGRVSAVKQNRMSEFVKSISDNIENKVTGVEFLAEMYDVFRSERSSQEESQEYIDAKSKKKGDRTLYEQSIIDKVNGGLRDQFEIFLEEMGLPDSQVEFAKREFESIQKKYRENNTEKGEPITLNQKIDRIKEQRQKAIDEFNMLYPIEKGGRGIDVSMYGYNEVYSETADFFNKLGNNKLKDLSPSELRKLPLIYENIQNGEISGDAFAIKSKIKGSEAITEMTNSSNQFSRMIAKTPKGMPENVSRMAEDFTLPFSKLYESEDPTSVTIKNSEELGKRMLAEQSPYIKYLLKDIKGDPVYEMINTFTGGMTVASKMNHDVTRKTYDLFYDMKGLPLENNQMLSVFGSIREYDALDGFPSNQVLKPILYLDAKIENARKNNQGVYESLVDIKEKYFNKDGSPKRNDRGQSLVEVELMKRGATELIKFMDESGAISREMARVNAQRRGILFTEIDGHMATRAEQKSSLTDKLDFLSKGRLNSSVNSDVIKSRTGQTERTFDAIGDFLNSFTGITNEYHMSEPVSVISNFVTIANKTGNVNLARYANAIKDYTGGLLEYHFNAGYHEENNLAIDFIKQTIQTAKSGAVFGIISKPIAEVFSQGIKIVMNPETLSASAVGASVLSKAGNGVLNFDKAYDFMEITKSTHLNRAGTFNSEIHITPSYWERKMGTEAGRKFQVYNKIRPLVKPLRKGKRKTERASELSQIAPDAFGVIQVKVGSFFIKFKEITGSYPDFDKIIDKTEVGNVYRAKYSDAIRKATAYSDQLTSKTAAPGSMAETAKRGYALPPLRAFGYKKTPGGLFDNMTLFETYPTSERRTILINLKQMRDALMKPMITKGQAKSWTGDSENAAKIASELSGRGAAGLSYQISRMVMFSIVNMAISIIENLAFGTDEDEIEYGKEIMNGTVKGGLDVAFNLALGPAPWPVKIGAYGLVYAALRVVEGDDKKKEGETVISEEFRKSMYLPKAERYQDVVSFTSKFGIQGKIAADATELAFIYDDLVNSGDPSFAKNFGRASYLIARNSAPTPQEASRGMRILRTMEKVENVNYLMYGNKASYLSNAKTRGIYRLYEDLEFDKSVLPPTIRNKESITNEKGDVLKYEIDKNKLDGLYNERGKIISGMMDEKWMASFMGASDNDKKKMLKEIYGVINSSEDYQKIKDTYFIKRGKRVN